MNLDTLTEAPFAARVGATLTLEATDGELALEILDVKLHPLAAGPGAKRTPFNVILRGPDSPDLPDGHYHLRLDGEGGGRLEMCFVNRIIPPANTDGRGAFYQIAFC
jgi:hypothetical protein